MKNLYLLLLSLCTASASAQNLQPFFAPATPQGNITVQLVPTEAIQPGQNSLITFGLPFPRNSIQESDLSTVRAIGPGGQEIPLHVEQMTPWRHAGDPAQDGKSVRVARLQLHWLFQSAASQAITIQWGGPARTLNVPGLENPRNAWHLVTNGSFEATDMVSEPDVYVLLPKSLLSAGLLKPAPMRPYDSGVMETREDPAINDTISHWPGLTKMDHAQHNFLFTLNNDDDPAVTAANKIPYKTDFEPWLYDRSAAMFVAYFRSGWIYELRQGVRNAQFYWNHLYKPGITPNVALGVFDLKIPDPAGYIGGNGAMYSYAECLAYEAWLTGDTQLTSAIDWVVAAHENQSESLHWSPTLGEWTERHTGFRLLANIVGYEFTGNTIYRDSMLSYISAYVAHQNGASGNIPASCIPGGLYHYGSQHGDGSPDALTASSWMSVISADAMIRAYACTERSDIVNFIHQMGYFLQSAVKSDDGHQYDTYCCALSYPDYMMRCDGSSDERDGSEVEHALETATLSAWAAYFSALNNMPDTALAGLAHRLYFTYEQGVDFWTRPTGPTAGKAAYRVNPPRKYAWEYRPSGSLSWLLEQLTPTTAVTISENVGVAVFPNPCNGRFRVRLEENAPPDRWQLFNSTGQQVANGQCPKINDWEIDATFLPDGTYFLQIVCANGQIRTGKVIVR
ncbi:MAG: T9SS type A sorting domain-containing protein [Saprospiraceae bacterium]|nr:T9SS type A sorting domain-containing protein [Saprospiraceae bacterium]